MNLPFFRGLPRVIVIDVVCGVLLFTAAAWWSTGYYKSFVDSGRRPDFYQGYFEPAVMLACGRGFTVSTERPAALDDFLALRTDRFDCGTLPPVRRQSTDRVFQYGWFYLMTTVGLTWKMLGVSWNGLVPLFGTLFGLTIVLAYAVFRLAVPPLVAMLPATALIVSPLHLQNLPHLRDYAKAPFVLALILLLLWMVVRPLRPRVLLTVAATYGAVLGLGFGFRSDLLANIPPFVAALVLFLPGGVRANLALKAGALMLAGATLVAAAWPVASYVSARGGCQWHVILLGLDDHFTRDLGVASGVYQWHGTFSDEYLHTAIRSYHDRLQPPADVPYCSTDYDAASGQYYRAIVSVTPADLLIRAYASVVRVADLPFYLWGAGAEGMEPSVFSPVGRLVRLVAGSAAISVVVAVALLGARHRRLGIFAVLFILYFGGYPSLQFANRHFFHLEFIGWWAMVTLGWQLLRVAIERGRPPDAIGEWRPFLVGAARFVAVVLLLIVLPVPVLRAYQNGRMREVTDELLAAPRVAVVTAPGADDTTLLPAAPALDADDPMRTVYFDVHVDLSACPGGVSLGVRYAGGSPYDFSGPLAPPATPAARILLPAYRNFTGFTVAAGHASCVSRIERLTTVRGRALLPVLMLPPPGSDARFHQSIKRPDWMAPFHWFRPDDRQQRLRSGVIP